MKLKRSGFAPKLNLGNKPHHGMGQFGRGSRQGGLMGTGTHLPQRTTTGVSDRHGYDGSTGNDQRATGKQSGKARGDQRKRNGAEGLGKGSPPPGTKSQMGVRGTPDTHLGTAGRGGTGKLGGADSFKGRNKPLSENPTSAWFESLGAK